MRTVFSFILLLVVGCSPMDVKDIDFSPMAGSGRIVSVSSTDGLDDKSGLKVTVSNHLAVGETISLLDYAALDDIPLGYYWGFGSEEDASGFHGGLTYRLRNSVGLFAGLSSWERESISAEFGAQLLFDSFSIELRRDESIGGTFVGMGMEL